MNNKGVTSDDPGPRINFHLQLSDNHGNPLFFLAWLVTGTGF